jgi:hypothetical protein
MALLATAYLAINSKVTPNLFQEALYEIPLTISVQGPICNAPGRGELCDSAIRRRPEPGSQDGV